MDYVTKCSFCMMSCDKYHDAWRPFFELLKKFWENPTQNTYLVSEEFDYKDSELNLTTFREGVEKTWSQRLMSALKQIPTDYIILSLEDFFLLDKVKEKQLEQCLHWMEEDPRIAVCHFYSSSSELMKYDEKYGDFRIAGTDVDYRVSTQFALWRKDKLMSYIDETESPWSFEINGSERSRQTADIFLWHYNTERDPYKMVFPYYMNRIDNGMGIMKRKWLWNNKSWFEQNGIYHVKYHRLGTISKKGYMRREYYLREKCTGMKRVFQVLYKKAIVIDYALQDIRVLGVRGIKYLWHKGKRHLAE